ncbi:MAG: hypothetical protein V3R90_14505 [Limibaculum sp.]
MAFKAEHRQWLQGHGVWERCWKRKEELKALGDTPAVAQKKALAEFYRPDGEPVEVQVQAGDSPSGGNGDGESQG